MNNFLGTNVLRVNDDLHIETSKSFDSRTKKIAIFVGHSSDVNVRSGEKLLIKQLVECGYNTVFVRATDSEERKLNWGKDELPQGSASIVRSNFGYDFGSWATAFRVFPQVKKSENVLLINDSIVGPIASISGLLSNFESSDCEVWAATTNNQHFPHLQTFFTGFKSQSLEIPPLQKFWKNIFLEPTKEDVVRKYELGLSRLLFSEAITFDAAFPSEIVVDYDLNPSLDGWQRLLELGFPFLKKMILTNPEIAFNGESAPSYINEMYGVDIRGLLF